MVGIQEADAVEEFSGEGYSDGEELMTLKQYHTQRDGEVDISRTQSSEEFHAFFKEQGEAEYLDAKKTVPQDIVFIQMEPVTRAQHHSPNLPPRPPLLYFAPSSSPPGPTLPTPLSP